jgi:protein-S-isoprenylcysteine O-methyltransferase Ste14
MPGPLFPLAFTIPFAFVFWAVLAWAFVPESLLTFRWRERMARAACSDGGSLWLIVLGLGIANCMAMPLAFVETMQFPPSSRAGLFAAGLSILIAGSLLRRHCWHTLGTYFTSAVTAQLDQPVIERGAYRWVRHPSYSAGILMHLGYGLALGSWASALLVVGMCLVVYSYRIAVEERKLMATLGEPYKVYMRRHKRLIPYVY